MNYYDAKDFAKSNDNFRGYAMALTMTHEAQEAYKFSESDWEFIATASEMAICSYLDMSQEQIIDRGQTARFLMM